MPQRGLLKPPAELVVMTGGAVAVIALIKAVFAIVQVATNRV